MNFISISTSVYVFFSAPNNAKRSHLRMNPCPIRQGLVLASSHRVRAMCKDTRLSWNLAPWAILGGCISRGPCKIEQPTEKPDVSAFENIVTFPPPAEQVWQTKQTKDGRKGIQREMGYLTYWWPPIERCWLMRAVQWSTMGCVSRVTLQAICPTRTIDRTQRKERKS